VRAWISLWSDWIIIVGGILLLVALVVGGLIWIHYLLTHPIITCDRVRPDRWECR